MVADADAPASWCRFDDHTLTLFTSSAFLAAAVATLCAGSLARSAGRRATMVAAGLFYLVGIAINAGAVHVSMLVIGRILIGFGTGLANCAVPIYLSEIAPTHARGGINLLFQLATSLSILGAQLVNFALLPGRHLWRVSVGIAAAPAALLALGALALDDSPASLAARGKLVAGKAALQKLRGAKTDISREWASIEAAHATDPASTAGWAQWRALGARRVRPELVVALGVAFGSQTNGINAILFYAAPIFSSLGAGGKAALLASVAVGVALFAPTLIAAAAVDRIGRRPLLITGGIVMMATELALAGLLGKHMGHVAGAALSPGAAKACLALMCSFVTAFALSWGPCGWLVPSEVFPLDVRAAGQAAATAVNFLTVFATTQFFLTSMCAMRHWVYVASAVAVALATLFVAFLLPETRGVPLERIDDLCWGRHWLWKRYAGHKAAAAAAAAVNAPPKSPAPHKRRAKMSDDFGC